MDRCLSCGTRLTDKRAYWCGERCKRRYNQKTMVLTLKKQWFDMIASGIKTEEYREMKPYWEKRFINYFGKFINFSCVPPTEAWDAHKKDIIFRNGYGKNAPEFTAECSIREDYGNVEWGAEKGRKYYVLTIHHVSNVKNIVEAIE